MTHSEIREKFLKFFSAKGGPATGGEHKIVPSSSLLPTDPSVLFTTAGMQQFKPYYTGQGDALKDFGSLNTVSIQKSMRTSDIDEVGDETHLTFFEMLGNFSFGGYWKKEAIEYAYEFITKELGLKIDFVSVFEGLPSAGVPADDESEKIWKSLDSNIMVKKANIQDNFWGPTGSEGPCGPTTEIYVNPALASKSGVNGVEVWNIVFNEFFYPGSREELLSGTSSQKLKKLKVSGIDTGMGLERLAMVVQKKNNIFETDLFEPLIQLLPGEMEPRIQRIIVDHSRAAAFLISDGVVPSNKEQGYILRRLLRRIIVHSHNFGLELETIREIFGTVVGNYGKNYPELNKEKIISEFDKENDKFQKTLKSGLKELEKLSAVDSASAFKLYESFGLPYEVIKEVGGDKAEALTRFGFEQELERHREISRAGAEKKFGGHGMKADSTDSPQEGQDIEETKKKTRLHTATHVVVASLEKVLGEPLKQAGADITAERLRFDFAFLRKLTTEELQQAEKIANQIVADDLEIWFEELPLEEAFASGAHGVFAHKYPPRVNVYTIGPKTGYFSREICGGPHVSRTSEIGHIKITKEESVSGGNRRIRAIIE